ncbi:uncharacterized protein LOC132053929 [Lycium ferocissimum]|uniref:uncharacterized protein LOC132053929 n=1 Tax=Lycium ferocissimum TaxID=112874 RepID=UPI00281584B5|nr:uncharacterized protein LOC132053929 [Lycium ferocissimum]
MRGDFLKVPWRRLVCNNYGAPKWIFILRLVAHGRLYTRDRLDSWGITTTQDCSLCLDGLETLAHLFFHCPYSATIWETLLHWQGIYRISMIWPDEMQWAATHANGKNSTSEVHRMVLAASVYHIWIERNHRIFQHRRRGPDEIIRQIIQEVFHRGQLRGRLAQRLEMLNFYPQLPTLPVQLV